MSHSKYNQLRKRGGAFFINFLKLKTFQILTVVVNKNNSSLQLWIWDSLAVMKGKITSCLKPSLTKSLWDKKKTKKTTDLLLKTSLMKFLGKKNMNKLWKTNKVKMGGGLSNR